MMFIKYSQHARQRLSEIQDRANLNEKPTWITDLIITYGKERLKEPNGRYSIFLSESQLKDFLKIIKRTRVLYAPDKETVVTVTYPYRQRSKRIAST